MTIATPSETTTPNTARVGGVGERKDYHALNAQLNLFAADGSIQFDKDHEAAEAYLNQQVIPNTKQFASVWERLEWLIENEYYEAEYLLSLIHI